MRKLLTLTLASTAVVALACSKKSPVAMTDDLKQDLKLASTTQDIRINPDEITPTAKPAPAVKPHKAVSGPKVVRSQKPTVLASAAPVEAAEVKADIPDVQVMAPAPQQQTESAPEAPPLARPSSIPVSNPGNQGAGNGRADGGGSGAGGILGGILGAVIRGGIVGDDDHCDPRTMPRNGRRPTGTDIGVYGGGMGGMGGMRLPTGIGSRRP